MLRTDSFSLPPVPAVIYHVYHERGGIKLAPRDGLPKCWGCGSPSDRTEATYALKGSDRMCSVVLIVPVKEYRGNVSKYSRDTNGIRLRGHVLDRDRPIFIAAFGGKCEGTISLSAQALTLHEVLSHRHELSHNEQRLASKTFVVAGSSRQHFDPMVQR